ncbi:DUF4124 domain-containing protein [Methylophaga thiooxydans]|uniref:Uncharacterized protein n=1 Tax=Methylophaga thiooxydans DMS010 TaxID=637616 RepID=C0N1H5_9GAMM|nr:DUF4124 domain-containing protein [Methylophaga thiooxydans]EEF81374.1 hypothetical protein MDMS009_43 [Methylophaga thiooxydans DMS010]
MMIRKFLSHSICILSLLTLSFSAIADRLYRFPDENGVLTLSRSLPPEAAQKGYVILDDKTMRVIERVAPAPTEEEIAEIKAQQAKAKEQEKQAKLEAEKAQKHRQQQASFDRTLLITYPTEQDLIDARDKDINYRKEQIDLHLAKLPKLEQHLIDVQKQAAARELSGSKISDNMQKRLDAAHEEIAIRNQAIQQYRAEIESLSAEYAIELERLRYLLQRRSERNN